LFEPDRFIAAVAARQFGVFSHEQAISAGFSRATVQQRVSDGRWLLVRPGVYAIAGVPRTFESNALSGVLQVDRAFASHRTAAFLHGLDGIRPMPRPELIVFDRRGIPSRRLIVHRPRVWLNADESCVRGVPTTSVARTLFDLAAVCRQRVLEIAFDDALRRELVSLEQMKVRLAAVSRPGVRGLRAIAPLIADRSSNDLEDSELETMFRKLITKPGLPEPELHYKIWGDDGTFVAEVDFAYPQARLAIELDSWTHHGSRKPFDADRVKDYELFDIGWHCLRFTKSDLRRRGDRVVSVVRRALLASGPIWRGQSGPNWPRGA
jgi:hypothetical protein